MAQIMDTVVEFQLLLIADEKKPEVFQTYCSLYHLSHGFVHLLKFLE